MGIVTQKRDMVRNIELSKRCVNPVIAEIKVHSPQFGDLLGKRNIIDILRRYERAGVAGISYITESTYFKGDFDVFIKICKESRLPVLRKDFILSTDEIERTAEAGASAILLIARKLKEKTPRFVDYALENGLEPLVEVHSHQDIEIAMQTNARMIGINNRDIEKLETDGGAVTLTQELAGMIPDDKIIVSESGISTLGDLNKAMRYAHAVLIGTAFMKADNTYGFVKSFVEARLC